MVMGEIRGLYDIRTVSVGFSHGQQRTLMELSLFDTVELLTKAVEAFQDRVSSGFKTIDWCQRESRS